MARAPRSPIRKADLPAGLAVDWSPANQGWLVRWHDAVLRVLTDPQEVRDYVRDLKRKGNPESPSGLRRVHITDAAGVRLYNRLLSDGGPVYVFESGNGFVTQDQVRQHNWRVGDGWPEAPAQGGAVAGAARNPRPAHTLRDAWMVPGGQFWLRKDAPPGDYQSGSKLGRVSKAEARRVAALPASDRLPSTRALKLWWVPPYYVAAKEGRWRVEGGHLRPLWVWERGALPSGESLYPEENPADAPAAGYKLDQAAGTERGRQQLQVALVGEALAMAWPAGRATLHEARRAVAGAYGSLGSQHPMGDRYGDFRAVADAAARELQGRWRDREADAPATAARNPRAKATAGLGELQGGKVQAVAFPRADWTNKSARDWCKRNDFRTGRPTHTSGYFRFRQYDP